VRGGDGPGERIRVLIADDHEMVRRGLATFLGAAADLEVVGEAASGEEAVRLCAALRPDVVLMDLVLSGMDGVAATEAIRRSHPAIQVIALTSFRDGDLVPRALRAGAIGYLLKDVEVGGLREAIRAARSGRPTLAPEAARALIERVTGAPAEPPPLGTDLSEREREVLALLVEGLSNPRIAQRLVVERSTVHTHVSSILGKLGAANRTEAVALAVQHRLVG
jgi:two-component system, NarL family, response regulator LiaR